MEIRAIDPVTGKDDRVFGGAGMIVVEKTELPLSLLSEKLRPYQTVVLKYKYAEDDVYINLYIPVLRLFRDGEFRWNTVHAEDKVDLSNERSGFVVERRTDRIDIHLNS